MRLRDARLPIHALCGRKSYRRVSRSVLNTKVDTDGLFCYISDEILALILESIKICHAKPLVSVEAIIGAVDSLLTTRQLFLFC
jgi:hypothetical protein